MRFSVPVHVVIESATLQTAHESAKKLQKLLDQSVVSMMLAGEGIALKQVVVFQPSPSK